MAISAALTRQQKPSLFSRLKTAAAQLDPCASNPSSRQTENKHPSFSVDGLETIFPPVRIQLTKGIDGSRRPASQGLIHKIKTHVASMTSQIGSHENRRTLFGRQYMAIFTGVSFLIRRLPHKTKVPHSYSRRLPVQPLNPNHPHTAH